MWMQRSAWLMNQVAIELFAGVIFITAYKRDDIIDAGA